MANLADEKAYRLLAEARQGERDAFAALAAEVNGRIRRFIWHLTGQTDSEDDIVQDVLVALYMNLERLEPEGKLFPFLFRVTRNRCYDLLRRQGRYHLTSFDSLPEWTLMSKNPQPDETADWLILYGRMQEAMNHLPELQRQTLILYAEEAFSYTEIAEAMNCNIGTVKSRLHQAKKNLRRLMNIPVGLSFDA